MKIKSITDVITNSSSEVFIISTSNPRYPEFKKLGCFEEFSDINSLRDFILSDKYESWDLLTNGDITEIGDFEYTRPRYDVFEYDSGIQRTYENWEKYKDLYRGLLGTAISKSYYDSPSCYEIKQLLYKEHFEKDLLPVIQKFIPGKKYTGNLSGDDQEVSFVWTGDTDEVTVEGSKFNPFKVSITTLLDLIKLETLNTNEI